MFEVRIHGRGGQGVTTAAGMFSVAAFLEGRCAQALPGSGPGGFGLPALSFCRIDDREIRVRDAVREPDAIIVQDASLLDDPGTLSGLKPGGCLVVDSDREHARGQAIHVPGKGPGTMLWSIPATSIGVRHLGRPFPNTALLGAFAALRPAIRIDSLLAAIRQQFRGALGERNAAAATEGYATVQDELGALAHA